MEPVLALDEVAVPWERPYDTGLSGVSFALEPGALAMVLLEAMTLLALGGDEVLAVVGDEPLPPAIWPGHRPAAMAAALVLAADTATAPPARAILEDLRQVRAASASADRPLGVDGPCAAILPLISAVGHGRSGRVDVSPAEDPRWSIGVTA